jgi:hypothetical protein
MSKLLAEAEDKMGGHLEAMSSGHLKQGRKLWAEGKVEAALRELSMVTHGEANVKAAEALIEEIRASRQQDEQDQAVQRAARVAGREDQGADPEELAKRMEAVRASLVAATWVNYAEDAEYGELSFAEEGTYALDGETAGDWELISPTQVAMDVGEGVRVSAEISGDGGSITFEGETFMKQ